MPMPCAAKRLEKLILDDYALQIRGSAGRYLTDSMKRALVCEAAYKVMLARYEAEDEKAEHTSPNIYVDAINAVCKTLEL